MISQKYKSYSEYKDSSIEWLGKIPSSWTVFRYKNIMQIMQGMAFRSSDYVEISNVVNVRMGNIKKGGEIDLKHNTKYLPDGFERTFKEYLLQEGDAIIAMTDMSPSLEFLAVPAILRDLDENSRYLLNQRVGKLIIEDDFDTRFLRYLLLSDELRAQLKSKGLGTVQANMSNEDLRSAFFACPSYAEIYLIANFLDHETAKIDTLIEEQKTLIRLLQEKRQAVISHAVTKGLNPDVPLKDSGVEWLGRVPEHWELTRFKFLCDNIIAGPFGSSITKDMYKPTGYKVYGQEQVIPNDFEIGDYFISEKDFSELSRYEVRTGEVLISCVGTFGKIAVFPDDAKPGIINPRLIKATLKKEHNPHFVREFLKSTTVYKQFELLSRGGTMGVINIAILNEILAAVPPKKEQELIAQFISEKKCKFRMLIEEAQQTVQLLQERRTALISATVTGKIDVRDWTPPAPQKEQLPKAVQAT